MSNEHASATAGQPDGPGLTRTGRALLAGVLGGIVLGALYGGGVALLSPTAYGSWMERAANALPFVLLGGLYGAIAGTLAGTGIALALLWLRHARLAVVRLALAVVAAPAPLLAMTLVGRLSGANVLEAAIIAITLPAGVVAGIAAAAAARWILTGHLKTRPNGRV